MTYQQLISTPCSALRTMTFDAYCNLLNASYREMIILVARQKEEQNSKYWQERQIKITALEAHIKTLCAAKFYQRFEAQIKTDIQSFCSNPIHL